MLQTLLRMSAAIGGMFAVLCLWAYIQGVVRRHSGCRNPNKDVLDFMLHGCGGGGCQSGGSCHSEKEPDSKLRVYEA